MATNDEIARQKRAKIVANGWKFTNFGDGGYAFCEDGRIDNVGKMLDYWFKEKWDSSIHICPYRKGDPWCASFVSLLANLTDQEFKSKYPYSKSQWNTASAQGVNSTSRVYTTSEYEVVPGTVASRSIGGSHCELVLEVTETTYTTVGGNTSSRLSKDGLSNRDGNCTGGHKWKKGGGKWQKFWTIWDEKDESLRQSIGKTTPFNTRPPTNNDYVVSEDDQKNGEQISAEQQAAITKYNTEVLASNDVVISKRLASSDDSYVSKATKTYVDKLSIKANKSSSRDADNTIKSNYDGSEVKTSQEEGSTRSPNSVESVEAYLAAELYAIKKRGEDGNDTGQTEFTKKTI